MGIDIGFVTLNSDGEIEHDGTDVERVANAPSFFNMVQMLTHIMPMIATLEQDDPSLRPHLQGFRDFLAQDRAGRLAKFRDYSDFTQQTLSQMKEISGGGVNIFGDLPPIDVEEFDEDLRVFLGGFMFSDRSFGPEEVSPLIPFLGVSVGLLKHAAEAYTEEHPQVAEAMHDAAKCVSVLCKYCDQAVDENLRVYIDC